MLRRSSAAVLLLFYFLLQLCGASTTKPNIIVIIADDLGRNDVGFHGSNQIPTPNLDALAYNGVILDRFYTQYACTPSRAALLTGNYPLKYGIQDIPIRAGENRSLEDNITLMPEHLKKLGYKTHLVGKWHLGAAYRKSTPLRRGFDTHFGYWHGFIGYFDHNAMVEIDNETNVYGYDLHDGFQPAWSHKGKYATELFTEKAVEVIQKHDMKNPLFLYLSHLAAHTGANGTELGVPNSTITDTKYSYIQDRRRRLYADVVNQLDDSTGRIVKTLSDRKMLDNSIILFFSDNGAQTVGVYENAGSNWPLRGVKLTDFEGGIRTAAAIYSPLFKKQGYVNKQLIHITDVLPTLFAAAGGDPAALGTIDGVNQWETISQNLTTNRSEVLVNINEIEEVSTLISVRGRYKLMQGTYKSNNNFGYYGDTGRGCEVPPYSLEAILKSRSYQAMLDLVKSPLTMGRINKLRAQTDLSWCRDEAVPDNINCTEGCLFNLENDPCETTNIIGQEKVLATRLRRRINEFTKELVPQPIIDLDPKANPAFYNGTWCTWLDDALCFKTVNLV